MIELLEKAKIDRRALFRLKEVAVILKEYELASQIRQLELDNFPETKAEQEAKAIRLVLKSVGIDTEDKTCWLILETLKLHKEKGSEFNEDDAKKLVNKQKELWI